MILASKSPRRKELFSKLAEEIGFEFEIITRETDENLYGEHPETGVATLARRKGAAVAAEYPEALVVSSDTLVELGGVPLGKPTDEAEAADMLRTLSGRAHNVHTGIAIHYKGNVYSGVATTEVIFRELSDGEINAYVATGEPMDKAGAYGIQGEGGRLVCGYNGEFDTVVGFNITLLCRLIEEAVGGVSSLRGACDD
ncbi:MAG: septum formation protein Maf [Clostridia bacterium]|nr:septum formation protein Maf [Clostridia bacterium]